MHAMRHVLPLLTALLLAAPAAAQGQAPTTPTVGTAPSWNPNNPTTEHVRRDLAMLQALGNGDIEAGMNALGSMGYQLMAVTTVHETGASGWHLFRRTPWAAPTMRPLYEFRRLSEPEIEGLAGGDFDDGLVALERDAWELVAFTTSPSGAFVWYYFQRQKPAS